MIGDRFIVVDTEWYGDWNVLRAGQLIGKAVYLQPSAMGKSERNPQMEFYAEVIQHAGPLTIDELRAALPPNDDPFKPCRRSKGEKARNRKQRGGYR